RCRLHLPSDSVARRLLAGAACELAVFWFPLRTDRAAFQQRARGGASRGYRSGERYGDESGRAECFCAGDCRGRPRRVSRGTRPRAGRRSRTKITRAGSWFDERAAHAGAKRRIVRLGKQVLREGLTAFLSGQSLLGGSSGGG